MFIKITPVTYFFIENKYRPTTLYQYKPYKQDTLWFYICTVLV